MEYPATKSRLSKEVLNLVTGNRTASPGYDDPLTLFSFCIFQSRCKSPAQCPVFEAHVFQDAFRCHNCTSFMTVFIISAYCTKIHCHFLRILSFAVVYLYIQFLNVYIYGCHRRKDAHSYATQIKKSLWRRKSRGVINNSNL